MTANRSPLSSQTISNHVQSSLGTSIGEFQLIETVESQHPELAVFLNAGR